MNSGRDRWIDRVVAAIDAYGNACERWSRTQDLDNLKSSFAARAEVERLRGFLQEIVAATPEYMDTCEQTGIGGVGFTERKLRRDRWWTAYRRARAALAGGEE